MKLTILFSILLIPLLGCSCDKVYPPSKAKSIPPDAVWGGGPDGGAWFLCKAITGSSDRYSCKIFNESSGDITASGEFVIRKYSWDKNKNEAVYHPVKERPNNLVFSSFDGSSIYLADSYILLPDGWIEYPFSNGGGKKQLFSLGQEKSDEVEYKK